MGGLIWGVSSALHEATEIDRRRARYYNTDLAEYLIPVNADIDQAEVILVPEDDHLVNDLGIKGLGELGNAGTNAAVANAVYHATGIRNSRAADPAGKIARCAVGHLVTDAERAYSGLSRYPRTPACGEHLLIAAS